MQQQKEQITGNEMNYFLKRMKAVMCEMIV